MRDAGAAGRREPASISWRATVVGSHYAASCGHYLGATAAARRLALGGNAVDAAVTAAMALAVLQPDVVSFAGVAPTLVYLAGEKRVLSLAGLGYWPAATDVARLGEVGGTSVPEGILRQVVPAAPATHLKALSLFGTISFEEAATPALELARDGYAMYPELRDSIEIHAAQIDRYRENASTFRPGGRTPALGDRLKQENLARSIGRMIEAERSAPGNREAKLRAVHDFFYRGEIAREIDAFHRSHGGFMRAEDLAGFEVPVEAGLSVNWKGYQVHTCDAWCQGISVLEALKILEGMDLVALGHNSPAYLHAIAESLNLAFSDREAWVGDPRFVNVPAATLLSDAYAAAQRARIDGTKAFGRMPDPGRIEGREPPPLDALLPGKGRVPLPQDTIYACVVDAQGNAVSITPSDTMYDTPMIDGLGFAVSTRGMQGRLDPRHPCSVVPGKRPRLTPSPAMALKDGEFSMAWGTPGGDVQGASIIQVFLNAVVFGMQMQQAIEAPRVASFNFPNSFSPNTYLPGRLCVEGRISPDTVAALARLGHDIEMWPDKSWSMGSICAIRRDPATGMLHAGADPRRAAAAIAW